MRRRSFLGIAAASRIGAAQQPAPGIIRRDNQRPQSPSGIQIGDVRPGSAVVWSRADRPSRMIVTWRTAIGDASARRVVGPHLLDVTSFTGRTVLTGLPDGQNIVFEVQLQDLSNERVLSEPVKGTFRSPFAQGRNIRFLWSGDTCGQGWGINTERGGMRIYETMRQRDPNFFIHSGDTIYADGLIPAEVKLPDGSVWRNLFTEAKSKVAETLDDFRGNYQYNLMDENVRRFNATVPQVWQWDDHEVTNNWSESKDLSADSRYKEKNVPLLVARGTRAFLEYSPMRWSAIKSERVYRRIPYGPLLDVFVIDMRSYRGPNTHNSQETESAETVYLGAPQIAWLQQGLKESRAVWKVIAADMPIGLVVDDGRDTQGRSRYENSANGDGPALGRELEIARLLRFIRDSKIANTVWLTADTHYTAAHYYDPAKARFTEFEPFWEFVSGPLNAGTFGPNRTDDTFGIQVAYQKTAPQGQGGVGPAAGLQFFGEVEIDELRKDLTVTLRDLTGVPLFTKVLAAT